MLLKRFYDTPLAQASYLVGCAATGDAIVVDANRDVEQYLRAAAAEKLRIGHVTETHVHADFASGSRELAHRTGAMLHLSDEGDEAGKYRFPTAEERAHGASVTLLRDGDAIRVGHVRLDVMATPGHTPEHLAFLVTDTAAADRPMGAFTGDCILVGDVGRPDLRERAAGQADTMEQAARTLFRTLQRFKRLPDWLQLWPGHGAGSACARAIGAMPSSTLGYERLFNWGLAATDEDAFVREVLAGQPEPPAYFAQMQRMNVAGPRLLGGLRRPPRLAASNLAELLQRGAVVVDTRPVEAYAARHVPGTINIPQGRAFTTWAGWLLPYDRDVYLVVGRERPEPDVGGAGGRDDEGCADAVVRDLAMIGLDRVGGWFPANVLAGWVAGGRALGSVPQMSAAELAAALDGGARERGELAVLDVRRRHEWEAGHVPGVPNVPAGLLPGRLDELPTDRPLVLHCQGGTRSAIAASVLRARGLHNVVNLAGGFAAWLRDGHVVERAAPPALPLAPQGETTEAR
jgi:hydroxyacylglutathione hydrolase